MRRAFLLLAVMPLFASAQSWCPPEATWTYEAGQFLAGFLRMSYRADSLVDGYQAQVIDRYWAVQYPQPTQPVYGGPPVITYTPVAAITRFEEDVVYLRGGATWDTLYWFGAQVGEGWTMPHAGSVDCDRFVVSGIGTTVINGVTLRWLDFENSPRVHERIGSGWDFFMYCPNIIVDGPMGMRCYSDFEISTPGGSVNCEALVGVDEHGASSGMLLFPNPGTDHFSISLPPGAWELEVIDALGRRVLTTRSISDRFEVDASALKAGTYFVQMTSATGSRFTRLWSKQ